MHALPPCTRPIASLTGIGLWIGLPLLLLAGCAGDESPPAGPGGLLEPTARDLDDATVQRGQAATPVSGVIWRVTPEGDGDVATIQEALDIAAYGDEILLAPGRYTWTNQGTATPYGLMWVQQNRDGFRVRGEAGAAETVIDAENQGRILYMTQYNSNVVFDGITFTGGNAFASDYGYNKGGGVTIHVTSPTFQDCVFRDNLAEDGGGFASAGECGSLMLRCVFERNSASKRGGGVFLVNSGSTMRFVDCIIRENWAGQTGGGLSSWNVPFSLEDTDVVDNSADQTGGGISLFRVPWCETRRSTIAGNFAPAEGQVRVGLYTPRFVMESCIVAFGSGTAALWVEDGSGLALSCSDLFGNEGGDALGPGVIDEGGNFSADPRFFDWNARDLRLHPLSPCAPGRHPGGFDCGRIGAHDPLRFFASLSGGGS